VKNFLTLTLLSIGTPMLLMGDEVRRSQAGNNNAYCQDNEISWFDWKLVETHAGIRRFAKMLIALRLGRNLPDERFEKTLNELLRDQPVKWHGIKLDCPDFSHDSHVISATVSGPGNLSRLHLMVNAYWEALLFEIPPAGSVFEPWKRCIDTFLDPPDDICAWPDAPSIDGASYLVRPRSTVALISISRDPGVK
jgi:isoamylase